MKPKNFPARVRQRRVGAATRLMKHVKSLEETVPSYDTFNQRVIISNTLKAIEKSGTRSTRSKKNREEKAR